jgi:GNAT superfamily N-acetyltransferase
VAIIVIRDVDNANIDDLCRLCVTEKNRDDPVFRRGMEEKRKWATDMLKRWGHFAKLAYVDSSAAGFIQYEPLPDDKIVHVHCIYVPEERFWRRGIARKLFSSLVEDAKKPWSWFHDESAQALTTRTFPGEQPGQYSARLFFTKMGFWQVGDDPDFLYLPLKERFIYKPQEAHKIEYIPQGEDEGKVLIIYGPSSCPYSYVFLKRAEQAITEIAPGIPIRWMNSAEVPDEVKKRGNVEGCIVNAMYIKSFILNKEAFQKEVIEALGA